MSKDRGHWHGRTNPGDPDNVRFPEQYQGMLDAKAQFEKTLLKPLLPEKMDLSHATPEIAVSYARSSAIALGILGILALASGSKYLVLTAWVLIGGAIALEVLARFVARNTGLK